MFTNIAAYKFMALDAAALPAMAIALRAVCARAQLKGTILLSVEGINLCLVGTAAGIADFKTDLQTQLPLVSLHYKESHSATQPFKRMLVKIKAEIITFKAASVNPVQATAPHLAPHVFKAWYEAQREMIVLDTRNDYEIQLGKFKYAHTLPLKNFSDFPQAAQALPAAFKEQPIVTYCTGGIRCEKAAAWLLQAGFKEVYQLEGGILNYFEQCGTAHYEGECFVFDDRVALDANLTSSATPSCTVCGQSLTVAERQAGAKICARGVCDAHV